MSEPKGAPKRHTRAVRSAWWWVPSLYFSEGLPYVVVMSLSVVMYKRLGVSNGDIALYTSWLYLPWVIKPFWSPLVEVFATKRQWIVVMQLLMGAGFAGVAFMLPLPQFFQLTLAAMWLLAFSSATHDIAADGFYMLGLSTHDQAWFVGIRNTAYRLAMISGQGLLLVFAGVLEGANGLPPVTMRMETVPVADGHAMGSELPEFEPESLVWERHAGNGNSLQFQAVSSLTLTPRETADSQTMRDRVRDWNQQHGFYRVETASRPEDSRRAAWLVPWETWIRDTFGETHPRSVEISKAGNFAVVHWRLAQPLQPNASVTVLIQRSGGSQDVQIVEGERFRLTAENSHDVFCSLVQVDPRLTQSVATEFTAKSGNIRLAWTLTFYLLTALIVFFGLWHRLVLPHPEQSRAIVARLGDAGAEMRAGITSFFAKPRIVVVIFFLLLYRFAEAQLVKLTGPFLLDPRDAAGLGLSTAWVGVIYGTIGIVALTVGGILGGFAAAKDGLKAWIWWMAAAINLPNLAYIYLAYVQPAGPWAVSIAVAIEQFGYGFGFTAYMLYMLYVSQGKHQTAHYAFCTGIMALGMMIPGMFSGWLQELLGYRHFFVWILLATLPSFVMTALIPLDDQFGRKVD